jgi:hypothetical protein
MGNICATSNVVHVFWAVLSVMAALLTTSLAAGTQHHLHVVKASPIVQR